MAKRKATEEEQETAAGLTEFELEREKLIARNLARLNELGIKAAAEKLAGVISTQRPVKKVKKVPKPVVAKKPAGPQRRSSRLVKKREDENEAAENEATILAQFIISGDCPKCSKVIQKGHKKHLANCEGEVEVTELTPEEIEQQENEQLNRRKGRIQELELSGLIECTDENARFAVIGSTGKHYVVTLSDPRQTCQCMDFRMRKRQCKHILLVLSGMGIADNPKNWKEAMGKQLLGTSNTTKPDSR